MIFLNYARIFYSGLSKLGFLKFNNTRKDDEKRKDYDKDDYYIIRVRDMFKDDYVATVEESTNFLYIIGMVTLVMAIITTIAMFLQERK